MASTWFTIALSREQVEAGHLDRIRDAFAGLFVAAGSPHGRALFSLRANDGSEALYFHPSSVDLAKELLSDNGAVPCLPPLDEGQIELLVGHQADQRLLSS